MSDQPVTHAVREGFVTMHARLLLIPGILLAGLAAAAAQPAAKPATPSGSKVVFPSAVSPKYSGESPGKARMHTCRDQYQANKATGGNGGLKWVQKGGGYYSQCNKHLKS